MFRTICSRALRVPVSRSFSNMRSTNGTFVQQTTQKEFNWQKLVTVFTPPAAIQRFRSIEAELNALRMESKGAPSSVQPIDWSYWESNLQDKSAVAAIRKEYESIKFSAPEGLDLNEINTKLDAAIDRVAQNVPVSQSEIALYQKRIVRVLQDKETMAHWTALDWFDRYPGLEKQLDDRWEEGYQILTEDEEKVNTVDLSAHRAAWKKGQTLKVFEEDDVVADRRGDDKFAAEEERLDAVTDKMFKGLKEYDDTRAADIAEAKKIEQAKAERAKAAKEHHAHH